MSSTYPPLKCKVRFTLEKGTLDEQIPWPPCKDESLWGELTNRQAAEETISQIERLGCRWESADQGLLSIDIPPEVDERRVMQILETSAFEGQIYVDVGVLRNEVS
jgi:hypothetical protein